MSGENADGQSGDADTSDNNAVALEVPDSEAESDAEVNTAAESEEIIIRAKPDEVITSETREDNMSGKQDKE